MPLESPVRQIALTATVTGTLALVGDMCIGIDVDGASKVAVFPVGSTLRDGGSAVSIPGLGDVSIGEVIHATGGEMPAEEVPVAVPETCGTGEVLVLNPWR
jgi:hypothetical protein